jgi:hypothetical protein
MLGLDIESPPLHSRNLVKLVLGRSVKICVTPSAPGAVLRSSKGSERVHIRSFLRKAGNVPIEFIP